MDLLFRPVFARTRTPVIGPSSFPERQSSFSTDDNDDSEEGINNRIRPTSRVSSYIGFRPATPPIPGPETFPNLRNPDNVYHKPSGDQLAEMLKVVMMNQSTMNPVPIQYNSTILHVLEVYQDLRMQLIAKSEAIEVLKQCHTKDIKDFEELAAAWQQKESEYKIEMKKLEILLSKTEGGMESVAMARSRSVVHGAEKASDLISRGIGTIKARNAATNSQDAGVNSPDFGPVQKSIRSRRSFQVRDDEDSSANAKFESPRRAPRKRATIDSHSRAERSQFSESSLQLCNSPEVHTQTVSPHSSIYRLQTLTKSQLEALECQQALEFGVVFESSTESGADSSSISHHSGFPAAHGRQGLGISLLEKPLPEIPTSSQERAIQTTLDRFLHDRKHSYSDPNAATEYGERTASYQMGFSFQPGDDEDLLGRRAERDRVTRKTVDEHLKHCSSPPRPPESRSDTSSSVQESSHRPRGATRSTIKPKPSATGLFTTTITKPSQLPRVQDPNPPSRMDSSSSSVITAVRDNSGRSSANNSAGRPKLNRNAGTGSGSSGAVSTAVSAAVRAFAASKISPTISRKGSAAGSGSGAPAETQTRYDGEGDRSMLPSRTTSTTSVTSNVSGSEVGNGKKAVGAARRSEKF